MRRRPDNNFPTVASTDLLAVRARHNQHTKMTIKELIEKLQKEDPNRLVVCQKDPEGNGHSPLSDWWAGAYRAETTWSGEAGIETLTDEDRKAGYSEEDVIEDGVPALFLVPVN